MIIYFSGTGNSRMAALMLRYPGETVVELSNNPPMSLSLESGERVIWIFPVYAWGIPRVMKRYIKKVGMNSSDNPHFMVCTCGDDVGLTHLEWRKAIRKRGWRPVGSFSVEMPNTYVLLPGFDVDSPLKEEEKLSKAPARIRAIARAIRHEARVVDVVRGSVPWIKSHILRPLFLLFLMSPKPFHQTDRCVGCGLCASHCPMRNITMTRSESHGPNSKTLRGSVPVWGRDCAMCLECYHVCPHHAVAYGNATSKKGQYSGPAGVKKI